MMPTRLKRRYLLLAVAAWASALATRPLHGQSTGGVLPTAAALPQIYAGNCPASIEFIGHVTVTIPGTRVDYQWERSNGSHGKVLHATIGKAPTPGAPADTAHGQSLTGPVTSDKWRLGLPSQTGQYWEQLRILTPLDIRSPRAVVDVTCRN